MGNQQASLTFTTRWEIAEQPFCLYFQYGGEDTAKHLATRLGNITFNYGLFLPLIEHATSLRYEFYEWQSSWYTHHIYNEGYRNDGFVMGYWAGDQRAGNDGVGGKSHAIELLHALTQTEKLSFNLHYYTFETYSPFDYSPGYDLTLGYESSGQSISIGFMSTPQEKRATRIAYKVLF